MLLSRFWYVILSIALAAVTALLFVATAVYNSTSRQQMNNSLAADTQVVMWYLNNDARQRSSLLLPLCLDEVVRKNLSKATASMDAVPKEAPAETSAALRKAAEGIQADTKFDALFAVDQYGRVVGQYGFEQAPVNSGFELGGYPVVADALHGWVRDDTWVFDNKIYLVVARPVEVDTSTMPAGAVVGLRAVDAEYAKLLAKRTGAAVGFYADGSIRVRAAPEGFDASQLDVINSDIGSLVADKEYQDKGKSKAKILMGDVGVIYSKMSGEAWELGAGYVVGRTANVITSPLGFTSVADDKDKKTVPWLFLIPGLLGLSLLGILFTIIEHTRPLRTLKVEAQRYAKGEIDMLQVSRFNGVYRKIASDLNDGADKVAAKGGAPRKAADLESVLGPIPAQPSMSAFSFPMESVVPPPGGPSQISSPGTAMGPPAPKPAGPPVPPKPQPSAPQMPAPKPEMPAPKAEGPKPLAPKPPAPKAPEPAAAAEAPDDDQTVVQAVPPEILEASATGSHAAVKEADEISEWHNVYEEFLRTKKQCGEPIAGLTFEKFQQTLRKNRDQLMGKTSCKKVKFSVYVKDGRAALKASPVRS